MKKIRLLFFSLPILILILIIGYYHVFTDSFYFNKAMNNLSNIESGKIRSIDMSIMKDGLIIKSYFFPSSYTNDIDKENIIRFFTNVDDYESINSNINTSNFNYLISISADVKDKKYYIVFKYDKTHSYINVLEISASEGSKVIKTDKYFKLSSKGQGILEKFVIDK